jgi:transcriptional regulator with XRE-family HTH domain
VEIGEIFSQRVRAKLTGLGWTHADLAKRLGIAGPTVSQTITDGRAPRIDTLLRWADALGVKVEHLLGRDVDVYDPQVERLKARVEAQTLLASASDDAIEIVLGVLRKSASVEAGGTATNKKRKPSAG